MISLDEANQPINRRVVATPGGFAWWYGEVLDENQSGAVVIWSFGLPFLPDYMSKIRKGAAETPCERASVNIVTYNHGVPDFYLLHEFRPGDVSWDGRGNWRFGNTSFTRTDQGGQRTIEAHIDIPMTGGGRLEGRMRFGGKIPSSDAPIADSEHRWTPLIAPCFGTAMLKEAMTGFRMSVAGRGYVDRNASTVDLEGLGIDRWFWAHEHGAESDRIAYALWPKDGGPVRCYGFEIQKDGCLIPHDVSVQFTGEHRRAYGMRSFRSYRFSAGSTLFMEATLESPVDDGPFYLRYLTRSSRGRGSAELISPSRIDRGRHRPLVKMRVQSDRRRNSRWLPLFQGSRQSQQRYREKILLPPLIQRMLP